MRQPKKRINKSLQVNQRITTIMLIVGISLSLVIANVLFTMVTGTHFRSGKDVLAYKSGSGVITEKIIAQRGHIYDRNKEVIAQDIEAFDLVAVLSENRINASSTPAYVVDVEETSNKLAPILECEASVLAKIMNEAKKNGLYQSEFGELGKALTAAQKEAILALDLPGIEFNISSDRVYPNGIFASQLVGYAQYNYDEDRIKGVMGLESIFDEELSGSDGEVVYKVGSDGYYLPDTKKYTKTAENGSDIYLTIDKNAQLAVESALKATMEENEANWAMCIVMEADTGKILAQAGYPSFDANKRENIENYLNAPSEYTYEPGSLMKPFVYAGAMQAGVYNGNNLFNSKSMAIGIDRTTNKVVKTEIGSSNHVATINNALGNSWGNITLDEGLLRSSNTAIVELLTQYYDQDLNVETLKDFGFFKKCDIYGLNETNGVLANVKEDPLSKITLGFGQGSTVNAYQLIQAMSALYTDGTMKKPYIVDRIVDANTGTSTYVGKTEKIDTGISADVCKQVQQLLKKVVSEDIGTASHLQMSDISFMAKTGTGEVVIDGRYSNEIYTTGIMAAAPADNPKVIVYYTFQSSNYRYYSPKYFQEIVRESLLAIDGYSNASQQTTQSVPSASFTKFEMPSLVNHSISYAKDKLKAHTSNIVQIGDGNSVIAQYPISKENTLSSQKVFLLTNGANIKMPNMIGYSRKDIALFEKFSGFKIKIKGKGTVKKQSIPQDTVLNKDMSIEVELE